MIRMKVEVLDDMYLYTAILTYIYVVLLFILYIAEIIPITKEEE